MECLVYSYSWVGCFRIVTWALTEGRIMMGAPRAEGTMYAESFGNGGCLLASLVATKLDLFGGQFDNQPIQT